MISDVYDESSVQSSDESIATLGFDEFSRTKDKRAILRAKILRQIRPFWCILKALPSSIIFYPGRRESHAFYLIISYRRHGYENEMKITWAVLRILFKFYEKQNAFSSTPNISGEFGEGRMRKDLAIHLIRRRNYVPPSTICVLH